MPDMQNVLAEFDGYTLRAVTDADRPALEAWIEADQRHNGVLDPEFFMGLATDENGEIAPDPRPTCCALEDKTGVVFFIRLSRASRVNIQFAPAQSSKSRRRAAMALLKGIAYLEVQLAKAGAEEWIFETEDRELAEMAKKRLGFVESPNEMVRVIGRPEEPKEAA
ncbi:MAG TPA: hypothetical protein VFE27_24325 [Acidobacteriaceae bacterium]|jgi:hypothetical protein|nr:hypothetical protein [Acidobacteriaceae bacterium]